MKLFSFITRDQNIKIGIDVDGKKCDFTYMWEIFKDIQGKHKYPQLNFIQVMISIGIFNSSDIKEVVTTVQEFRSLDTVKIDGPLIYDVPIPQPQKIVGLGRNYKKHAQELDNPVPDEPIIFAKMPSSLLPHEGAIVLPRGVGRVDHELELAIVIGLQGKNISESKAYEYIAGYTILNDVTARALQKSDNGKKQPWLRSKSFDTFCPTGPFLVPHDAIDNPHRLGLTLRVNDEVRQQANTSELIFKIPEIIHFVSRHMTLNPGDIIATGTPEGVSELKPGDTVTGEIDKLGKLENSVVAE